jgi:hypothetical protein
MGVVISVVLVAAVIYFFEQDHNKRMRPLALVLHRDTLKAIQECYSVFVKVHSNTSQRHSWLPGQSLAPIHSQAIISWECSHRHVM